ncbi:MAG: hypothetical protein ACQERH_05225 [Acidobacteriota bacterium]
MDVYLTWEAREYLEGLALSNSGLEGILLGHKRGPEYYIEQVFPYHNALSMTDEIFTEINQHFNDGVMGFYFFSSDKEITEKILVPFSVGKVILRIDKDKKKNLKLDSHFIDYDEKFSLKPNKVHSIEKD